MDGKGAIKVFYNGSIYTKFDKKSPVESIVVKGDRITFYGTSEESMKRYATIAEQIINLGGKVVFPGFVDSHLHLDDLGSSLTYLDLRGTDSIVELKERLRSYRSRNPGARVIIGMGWDQESFSEGRWPERSDLDGIVNDVPVFLERFCEHAGVINSKMLDRLESVSFPEKVLPRSRDGRPNGIVKEEAASYFKKVAHDLIGNEVGNLSAASNYLLSLGVTSIGFVSCGTESVEYLANEASRIGIRVRAYMRQEEAGGIEEMRMRIGENSYLKINGIKLFADGALGAATAALREPYDDGKDNRGMLVMDSKSLEREFEKYDGRNVQFAMHAIGDRGIDAVIEAVSNFGRDRLIEPRIEHCTVLREDHINRLKELRIGVSTQPAFVIDDWWAVNRLGKERSRLSYPLATLQKGQLKVGLSTDCPVEPPNPWFTVDAAVNRGEREKREILKYSGEERVNILTAPYLYTTGSASLLMDSDVGSLEVGNFADFIILDSDPFELQDVRKIRVLETYVGGVSRFRAKK